ncbi:MMPL family transporter [uncultured Cellulomonas sp.]|uniref:MMPL family transporter n=1 Tax=uncultured Cellulomonas sp. TaxID=189682 RepID=UPI00261643FD|nr:MMPL family transporter [uncultured Cellulomonas sp.]
MGVPDGTGRPATSSATSPGGARPPGTLTGRRLAYARWTVRARWWIVASWALLLGVLSLVAPRLEPGGDDLSRLIPQDLPAIQAELRSVELFGFPLSSRTVVVQRDPEGMSVFAQAESVLDAIAVNQTTPTPPLLGALPVTNALPLAGAAERDTTVLTYLFMDPGAETFAGQLRSARAYIAENLDRPEDAVVGVAGSVPARAEQARIAGDALPRLELLTVLAIVVLVSLNFRAVLVPALALGASAVAFGLTVHLSHVLSTIVGIGAPAELEPLMVALLLGVVTDYTVFYVSSLRSSLERGTPWGDAVVDSVARYTPIIVAAGVTVAAGTAALLAAQSTFYRAFGPAMALAVLVGLVVSVTLLPALVACIGPRLLWPYRPAVRSGTAPTRRRRRLAIPRPDVVAHLTRRPVAAAVLAGCVAVLGLASVPLTNIALGLGFTSSLPADNPVSRASQAGAAAFAPGITAPTTLLLEADDVTADRDALARLQAMVERQPGVAGVVGPAQRPGLTDAELGVVLARGGDAARMLVVLENEPLDAAAIRDLAALTERLPELAADSGLGEDVRISVAGDTALAQGVIGSTGHDLLRIGVVAVVVNLLVLVVFLRALVAPLYLLASSVLALTASLGVTVWVFMGVLGRESLTFYVPFAAAVLLVALGSDYNIFGVGHVWDEARRRPLRDAIRTAMPESTRAITTAGVVLAVSFGMLGTIPLGPFQELAFAMFVGILIDVLVVRSLLVPCLLTLVGPASAWPSHRLHRSDAGVPPGTA